MLSRSDKLKRRKINKFLSFIVICVTLSVLIIPAFTLEKKDDDTNDNNDPATVENVNKQGGAEPSSDSALELVVNNNNEESSSEDDVLVVGETGDDEPMLLAEGGTTTTTGFDLSADTTKIEKIALFYQNSGGTWAEIPENGSGEIPANASIKIEVKYKDIQTQNLKTTYNGTLTFDLPDILKNAVSGGNLMVGSTKVGDLTVNGGMAMLKFTDEFLQSLIDKGKTTFGGDFKVEGKIDLSKLPNTGGTTITIADKSYKINFGDDPIAKYGDVKIEKQCTSSKTITINDEEYLSYTIKVTAGEDGCPNVSVVDTVTTNSNLITFVWIDNNEVTLGNSEDNQKPFETREDGKTAGTIYKGKTLNEDTIPSYGASDISEPGSLVWKIGDMSKNEIRTLTYYVKLNENNAMNNKEIQNVATVFSKNYKRVTDKASFTPKIDYNMLPGKECVSNVRNEDGTYTIKYKIFFDLKKDGSTYSLKGFEFWDYLNYFDFFTDERILPYVNYNRSSVELFKREDGGSEYKVDKSKYVVTWSKDKTNYYKEWTDSENPKCFKIVGSEGNPLVLNPGDTYSAYYTLTVKPEAFAIMKSDVVNITNRYLSYAKNFNDVSPDYINKVFRPVDIGGYEWNNKTVGEKITADQIITIPASKFDLTTNILVNDSSTATQFTVPAGSYPYVVNVNKTLGDWDATQVTMTDNLNSTNMQYTGYMCVDASEYDVTAKAYIVKDTKWVKIDGLNSFSLKPLHLGWNNKNYAYTFTYYGKPVNQDTYGSAVINNTFTLIGSVGRGGKTYSIDGISSNVKVTVTGDYSMGVNKHAWYYEEAKAGATSWTKGKLYWVVEVDGTAIKKDTIFSDSLASDGTLSYLHEDSLIGIYQGNLPDGKPIAGYKSIDELIMAGNFVDIKGKFSVPVFKNDTNFTGSNYKELEITAKENIEIKNIGKIYILIASEPSKLPVNYRDALEFKNKIYANDDGVSSTERANATKMLCGGSDILKELGQTFSYDGTTLTILNKDKGGDIATNGLKGTGIFASWAFKVNYAGDLAGTYRVLETIPSGMELEYVRVKWTGTKQGTIGSKEILGLDGWEKKEISAATDNGGRVEKTIYYVKGNQALIELGDFKAGHIRDDYSVDVQVVCRVVDPKALLNNEEVTYTNEVELQTADGEKINTAISPATFKTSNMSKTYVAKAGSGEKIDFTIKANPLGQALPTQGGGTTIKLIDKLSSSLSLDTTTIKVINSKTNEEVTYKASIKENNVLEIEVPSNIPITITYTALVNVPPGTTVSFSNEAYWEGYKPSENSKVEENSYSYTAGGTVTSGDNIKLEIVKENQNNLSEMLPGAVFEMTKYEINDDGTLTETTKKWAGTTDVNGKLTFGSGSSEDTAMKYNAVYKIVETKAPDGYVLDSTPKYIMVPRIEDGKTDYSNGVKICINDDKILKQYQETFKLEVLNHKGEITVEKKFKNAGGHDTGPISGTYWFGLYDSLEATNQLQKIFITYDLSDTTSKTNKFVDLDLSQTYYVYELDASGKPIKDSNTVNVINGMEYLTSYDKNGVTNGNTVTVTNQVATKQLPATGGNGTDIYIKSGAILMLLTVVVLLKRRR